MYWRRGHWQEIPDDKARIKVEKELGKELAKTKGQQGTLLVYCPNASTEIGDCPPSSVTSRTDVFECRLVTHVAYRALPFY